MHANNAVQVEKNTCRRGKKAENIPGKEKRLSYWRLRQHCEIVHGAHMIPSQRLGGGGCHKG